MYALMMYSRYGEENTVTLIYGALLDVQSNMGIMDCLKKLIKKKKAYNIYHRHAACRLHTT